MLEDCWDEDVWNIFIYIYNVNSFFNRWKILRIISSSNNVLSSIFHEWSLFAPTVYVIGIPSGVLYSNMFLWPHRNHYIFLLVGWMHRAASWIMLPVWIMNWVLPFCFICWKGQPFLLIIIPVSQQKYAESDYRVNENNETWL